jgi:hypothetical protein
MAIMPNATRERWTVVRGRANNARLGDSWPVVDSTRLQKLLGDLHRELSAANSLDPESRRMLDQVLRDIRELTGAPADEASDGATAQLREAALRLEAEHPRLAAALGQLGDTLAKLGI